MQDAADSGAIEYTGYAPYLENQFIYDGTVAFIEMGSWIYNDVKGMDLNLDGESDIKVAAIPSTTEGIPGYATLGYCIGPRWFLRRSPRRSPCTYSTLRKRVF